MSVIKHIPSYKLNIITITLCLTFTSLFFRLIYLQIKMGDLFSAKSEKNFSRTETLASPRGNILDIHGNLLATNRPVYNMYWYGSGSYKLSALQKKKIAKLSEIFGHNHFDTPSFIKKIEWAERTRKKIVLQKDINFEQLSQLEEAFSKENISIETSFKRYYPYNASASHILGYLGRIDFNVTGKTGLEYMLENQLKGKQGQNITTINSLGRTLEKTTIAEAMAGKNIKTTLDIELQNIVESVFPEDQVGVCIIMNSDNGSILAITSRPNFDPNIFLSPISQEDWNALQHKQPFLNRALYAQYPPGSVFKLIVTSAALEHEIITPESIWNCKGYITFKGRRYHCHERNGHGVLTVSQALEQSCNPFFYDIGTKISIDTLSDYAHRFGLGEKTGMLFPERSGLVPNTKWKLDEKGEPWWPGETLSVVLGQSYLLTTPIQIARMIGSIFSGYLVTPRILADEPIEKKPLAIKPETLDFIKQSMKKVVTQGTGKRISVIKDIEIYAKTSTAQTSALSKRNKGKQFREHGWFVAHFQYKQNEPLSLVVMVEHAGTSRIPTNIARKLLIRYKQLKN